MHNNAGRLLVQDILRNIAFTAQPLCLFFVYALLKEMAGSNYVPVLLE